MSSDSFSSTDPLPSGGEDIAPDDDRLLAELRAIRRKQTAETASERPLPDNNRYEVIREIRRGGQGIVYEAIQLTTGRRVALKVLLNGEYSTPGHRHRFEREVDLLAGLNHPHVVTLHDSGVLGNQLFYAMEFVDGVPLHHFGPLRFTSETDSRQATQHLKSAICFFTSLTAAVAYCHQRGLIHRDLKPGNVMVSKDGQPVLVDFGLAKSLNAARITDSDLTSTGDFVGTLAYAAPEQATATTPVADVRSDVYSLGAILYELVTGQRPIPDGVSPAEFIRRIAEQPPARPSERNPQVNVDLEIIILKALSKDPDRRYQSAVELLRDIERWQRHLPIDARSDSTWYVISQRLKRHKLPVGFAAGFVVLMMAFGVIMFQLWQNAVRQNDEAAFQTYVASLYAADAAHAEHRRLDAEDHLNRPLPDYRGWEWDYLKSQLNHCDTCIPIGNVGDHIACWTRSPDRHHFISLGTEGTVFVTDIDSGTVVQQIATDFTGLSIAVDQMNGRLLVGGDDGILRAYPLLETEGPAHRISDAESTALRWRPVAKLPSAISAVCTSPDGRRIFVATGTAGSWDGQFQTLDSDGQPVAGPRRAGLTAKHIAIRADGQLLAVGSSELQLRDVQKGKLLQAVEPQFATPPGSTYTLTDLVFSDDGRLLVAGTDTTSAFVWDLADPAHPRQIAELAEHSAAIASVAFSPDGDSIVTSSRDQCVRLWSTTDGSLQSVFHGMVGWGTGVLFSADATRIIAAESRHQLNVYRANLHTGNWESQRHQSSIMTVRFSPDGQLVATGGADYLIQLTDVATGQITTTLAGHEDIVQTVAWSASGEQLLSGDLSGRVLLWQVGKHSEQSGIQEVARLESAVRGVALSSDNQLACVGCMDGHVFVFDLTQDGKQISEWSHADSLLALRLSRQTNALVTAGVHQLHVIDLASGDVRSEITREAHHHYASLALHPTRATVAVGGNSGRTAELSLSDGTLIGQWDWHQMPPTAAAFHPQGTRLVTAGSDGSIKLWDVNRHAELLRLNVNGSFAYALDWSPDGRRIAAAVYDGRLVMFEAIPAAQRKNGVID
ncbi:MAG: serine/threonine protein kinase [Planctomycetaceae bacterium]|nr:serine/threonine protein kinase [Planctomycetaceae bacterium]